MKRTVTTDSVIETDDFMDKEAVEGIEVIIFTILKYSFYPIYLAT